MITPNTEQVRSLPISELLTLPSQRENPLQKTDWQQGLGRIVTLSLAQTQLFFLKNHKNIPPAEGEDSKRNLCYELCSEVSICGHAFSRQEYKQLTNHSGFLFFA